MLEPEKIILPPYKLLTTYSSPSLQARQSLLYALVFAVIEVVGIHHSIFSIQWIFMYFAFLLNIHYQLLPILPVLLPERHQVRPQ